MPQTRDKPVLLVDIDGVLSLWGFPSDERPPGTWANVEGIGHFLSSAAAEHLHALAERFETLWCSGWEEKADEHLPALLGVPRLPHLSFDRAGSGRPGTSLAGHWKLTAIDARVGARPVAWVDDALDDACERWAAARPAPTLLVRTDPAVGLTAAHADRLLAWATALEEG